MMPVAVSKPTAAASELTAAALALVAAVSLAACSDALVDGRWPGEPLLTLQGPVELAGGRKGDAADAGAGADAAADAAAAVTPATATPTGTLRLALLWSRLGEGKGPQHPFATVAAQTVSTAEFPARYRLQLYAPPDADALGEATGAGQVAVGTLVVYVDADGDGAFDAASDALVGGAEGRLLLYSPAGAVDAAMGSVAAGYSRVRVVGTSGGRGRGEPGGAGGGSKEPPPAAKACGEAGAPPPSFAADLDGELPLFVGEALPDGALPDLDCDGKRGEWGRGACPPPPLVEAACAPSGGPAWPCDACQRP